MGIAAGFGGLLPPQFTSIDCHFWVKICFQISIPVQNVKKTLRNLSLTPSSFRPIPTLQYTTHETVIVITSKQQGAHGLLQLSPKTAVVYMGMKPFLCRPPTWHLLPSCRLDVWNELVLLTSRPSWYSIQQLQLVDLTSFELKSHSDQVYCHVSRFCLSKCGMEIRRRRQRRCTTRGRAAVQQTVSSGRSRSLVHCRRWLTSCPFYAEKADVLTPRRLPQQQLKSLARPSNTNCFPAHLLTSVGLETPSTCESISERAQIHRMKPVFLSSTRKTADVPPVEKVEEGVDL